MRRKRTGESGKDQKIRKRRNESRPANVRTRPGWVVYVSLIARNPIFILLPIRPALHQQPSFLRQPHSLDVSDRGGQSGPQYPYISSHFLFFFFFFFFSLSLSLSLSLSVFSRPLPFFLQPLSKADYTFPSERNRSYDRVLFARLLLLLRNF